MTFPHWKTRNGAVAEMRQDGRLALLWILMTHANIRMRCWPGTDLLAHETGWGREAVIAAKQWLLDHGAIVLVPFESRAYEEKDLPIRQHIYQLTGIMRLDNEEAIPYIYLNPEAETAILAAVDEIRATRLSDNTSKVGSPELRATRPKGIPSSEGIPSNTIAASATPPQQVETRKRTSYSGVPQEIQDQPEDINGKSKHQVTPLESLILDLFHSVHLHYKTKRMNSECSAALSRVVHAGITYNPNDLFDTDEDFSQYVEKKWKHFVDFTLNSPNADISIKHLVNMICKFEGNYGWPVFKEETVTHRKNQALLDQSKASAGNWLDKFDKE